MAVFTGTTALVQSESHFDRHTPIKMASSSQENRLTIERGGEMCYFLARASLGRQYTRPGPRKDGPSSVSPAHRVATSISGHPIVKVFDLGIRPPLRALLDDVASDKWRIVVPLRIGFHAEGREGNPLTILIAMEPSTMNVEGAADLVEAVANIVYRHEDLDDVIIEIIEGRMTLHAGKVTEPDERFSRWTPDFDSDFSQTPPIGSGIGLQGSGRTSTLGAYVRVRARSSATGAEKVIYTALTCHHSLAGMVSLPLSVYLATLLTNLRWL